MLWKLPFGLLACVVLVAALAPAADAAPRKKYAIKRYVSAVSVPGTVFVSRDETGRTRTRIIVTKRSYLDGGTEVLPGQRKFTDYVIPPYSSPIDALGPGRNYDRMPLNPRWENGASRMW